MSKIKNIMNKKPITASEKDDVKKLCKILSKSKLSGIPVTSKNGMLKGFVSERDVINNVGKADFLAMITADIMNKTVKTVSPEDSITSASKIFSELNIRILPVVKAGKVVGTITRKEVINRLLKNMH
jgi:CBS domain-containing protein